jgi:amylosucrase
VRADYDAARNVAAGDVAFDVRFERFFTELRDPLFALYGSDPRFAGAWERLLRAIAATAAE